MHVRCLILVSALLLSACDSGSSGSSNTQGPVVGTDEVKTGNFEHLRISGLGYRTDSLPPDVTDELGRFRFRTGENIAFFIGEQRIATIPAAESVALIEHLNPQLPDSADTMLAEVNTVYETSEFDLLINVLHALLRLDQAAQSNAIIVLPDNLSVSDDLLSALNAPMQTFADQSAIESLFSEQGNALDLHYEDTIVWLYTLLERTIASQRTEEMHTHSPNGSVTITEYLHAPDNQIEQTHRYDEATPQNKQITTYSWNSSEQIQQITTGNSVTHFTYNNAGATLQIEQLSGALRNTDTYTYSEAGKVLTRQIDVNGILTLEQHSHSTDPRTARIDVYQNYQEGSAADPDSSELRVYNAEGLLVRKDIDQNGSGSVERVIVYNYDAFQRLSKITQADQEEHRTYNTMGLLDTQRLVDADSQQPLNETRYHYDSEGRLISVTLTTYSPTGALINTTETTYSYFGTLLTDGLHNLLDRPEARLP